ncbi:MAG: flagellar export protein FliJ [Candidatus Zixiibacteriota bacterium]|nr:MAG: flagellar export protein FliJ [candidate division Zixibacteria bacterium]
MKKFRYRLQALLKLREQIEKDRQKHLAAASKQVQDQNRRLDDIEQSRDRTIERQRQEADQAFSVAEMLVISRYLHKLKRDSVVGRELLKVLMKEEDNKREELLAAARERRKYEKLKERLRDKHIQEAEATLTKDNDETAISTFRQKTKNGPS